MPSLSALLNSKYNSFDPLNLKVPRIENTTMESHYTAVAVITADSSLIQSLRAQSPSELLSSRGDPFDPKSLQVQRNGNSKVLNFWKFTQKWSGWISDSYCSLKPLKSDMGEVVPWLVPHRPYISHPLPLCCNYPVKNCPSASIVVTSTLRVNEQLYCHSALKKITPAVFLFISAGKSHLCQCYSAPTTTLFIVWLVSA